MVELEYHADQIDQHEIWSSVSDKTVTPADREEFESEMQSMIDNIRDELSSLQDKMDDAMREIDEAIPRCSECDEPIDAEECEDGICEDCQYEPVNPSEAEQDVLWW